MFQLTCRERGSGRGLVPVAAVCSTSDPAKAGLDRWTIFIHGFNNSKEAAAKTWRGTMEQLQRWQVDLGAVVLFYWPGDYSRSEIYSAMNYPRTVPIAEDTAKLLADYLRSAAQERSVPLQLSFIAHSLGSLVVLETLSLLRSDPANIIVQDALLMAAAVPEGFCAQDTANARYAFPFSPETKEVALYSLDDPVLKYAFQVGQEIARRFPEERRRAVGRNGGPGSGLGERWASAAHMDGFGHSDYWKKPASVKRIARIVAPRWVDPEQKEGYNERRDFLRKDSLPIDTLDKADYLPPEVLLWLLARPISS